MNKDWRKAIFKRTRLKNIFNRKRFRDNQNNYKKQRNLCTNLRKKSAKRYFSNVSQGKRFSSNRHFWKIIKPFLTNKGFIANSDISLKEENEIITSDKDLSETFNYHYINIIEKTTVSKPDNLHKFCDMEIHSVISKIKDTYANHSSIIEIKKATKKWNNLFLKEVKEEEILKLLKNIDVKRST